MVKNVPFLITFCLVLCFATTVNAEKDLPQDVDTFTQSYFDSWSRNDPEEYSNHFASSAIVQFLDKKKDIHNFDLAVFLEQQRKIITVPNKLREYPIKSSWSGNEAVGTLIVHWILEDGRTRRAGVDVFNLVKNNENEWKIVSLFFYFE